MGRTLNPRNGKNTRLLRLFMHSQSLPAIDTTDPKHVQERIEKYFDFCQIHGLFPSISGLCMWIGVHRDTLHSWKTGEFRRETHQKLIERAYALIESVLVDQLASDAISIPSGIFLLKSVFGYRDVLNIDFDVGKNDRFADCLKTTDEELSKKYLIDMGLDEELEIKKEKEKDVTRMENAVIEQDAHLNLKKDPAPIEASDEDDFRRFLADLHMEQREQE